MCLRKSSLVQGPKEYITGKNTKTKHVHRFIRSKTAIFFDVFFFVCVGKLFSCSTFEHGNYLLGGDLYYKFTVMQLLMYSTDRNI